MDAISTKKEKKKVGNINIVPEYRFENEPRL
jgi:hypothetical protein